MAREYIRPEIDQWTLKEFLGGRHVMINPTWEDVVKTVKDTEKRCRKNLLEIEEARRVWQCVMEDGADEAWAGKWSCPPRFPYGIQGTVLEIIRISDDLVGLVCERQAVESEQESRPVTFGALSGKMQDRNASPLEWLEAILLVFWMFLSEEEIEQLDRWVLQRAMELAAERQADDEAQRIRLRGRRRRHILLLLHGTLPEFTSEFQDAARRIAEILESNSQQDVTWKDFKKRWPSLATRYQKELTVLLDGNRLRTSDLRGLPDESPYVLSLSLWKGAQRLFLHPQVVFSIRCPSIHRQFLQKGEEHEVVSRALKEVAGGPWHPGTRTTIGWLRVHVDDEHELCFVDEVQSNTLEAARMMDQAAAKDFVKQCSDWHIHGFATICQWAREIGYRAAMHSRKSTMAKPGMTQSDRKWNTYYRPIIKRFGLQSETIDDYPAEIFVQPMTAGGSERLADP